MKLPKISNYGQASSSNYGAHTLCVEIGDVDVYYSYTTIVAFRVPGRLVVHRNDWTKTTGKHLNWIDRGRKDERVDAETFKKLWEELVESRDKTNIEFQTANGQHRASVRLSDGAMTTAVAKGFRIVIQEGNQPLEVHDWKPE